jgi:hypothetical protein
MNPAASSLPRDNEALEGDVLLLAGPWSFEMADDRASFLGEIHDLHGGQWDADSPANAISPGLAGMRSRHSERLSLVDRGGFVLKRIDVLLGRVVRRLLVLSRVDWGEAKRE